MSHIHIHRFHQFSVHRWYHWVILFILLLLMLTAFPRHAGSQEWEVFTTANSPLLSNWIEAIAIDALDRVWIGTISGLMRYDNGEWTAYTPDNSELPGAWVSDIDVDNSNRVWAATNAGVAVISGDDWILYTKENTDSGLKNDKTSAVICDCVSTAWVGTEGSAVCTYDGVLWEWYHYDRVPELTGYWINDLHCTPDGTVWIATKQGAASYNGISWTHHSIPIPVYGPTDIEIRCITSDRFGTACAITGYGLWKYGDLGWYEHMIIVENEPLEGMMVALFDNRYSAIASTAGLAVEGETDWSLYTTDNSPLPDNGVTALATGPDGRLWIGTTGGVAVLDGSDIPVSTDYAERPQAVITARPSYPNPFNSAAVIPYDIASTAFVTIELYTITGQYVTTLASGMHTSGRYSAVWNGTDYAGNPVPAALYLYRIIAPENTVTGKMVLVK